MNKVVFMIFMALAGNICQAFAIPGYRGKASTAITRSSQATHIARISPDTVVLLGGSTYSFTVDTPENQGLVQTNMEVEDLPGQIQARDGSAQKYQVTDQAGKARLTGKIISGDRLLVVSENGKARRSYYLLVSTGALCGRLQVQQAAMTVNTPGAVRLFFTAGQRSPDATVRIFLPAGIAATLENTTVNVIGRGEVRLKDLAHQSIGRVGSRYPYSRVGQVSIRPSAHGSVLTFSHLDLRPANGPDLAIVISQVKLPETGKYLFRANYTTAQPQVLTSPGTGPETATLTATRTISGFARVRDTSKPYHERPAAYTGASFKWNPVAQAAAIQLEQSQDAGKTWRPAAGTVDAQGGTAAVSGLAPNQHYIFRLVVRKGPHRGYSNPVGFYSGKMDVKRFGVSGDGKQDETEKINQAIAYLHDLGGGTLLFSKGEYNVRTVHLKSNVYLYVDKEATIKALKGADAPEATWFSDKKYRSGLSPTDTGPYADPENYLTKQDVGHTFFRNTMFFGERLDNVRIIGNGRITGNGNLVTSDKVMNNAPDNRADKMFTFKLCTNIEIGGLYRAEDLWYDPEKDEPYYIGKAGAKKPDTDNMLHIDRGGHFVLLATGSDTIFVHNTYFGNNSTANARDIYDFMACNQVTVTNIYSRVSSDDIVKPGSDCSLGFTRPASRYRVRNIIGDTNCNLFQIGSETADDIMDVCVDNIYVLGANKAGFSISTNDGGHVKDIHLNCGHTGSLHSRSKMYRTTTPFFISISNRGRILGAEVGKYAFTDNGVKHDELLVKNVNIGQVENIRIHGVDILEVYGGSAYSGKRWKPFDGTQKRASPIVAGYSLPAPAEVAGGLDFTLPNGKHTGYITDIAFEDVHVLVKGGHPLSAAAAIPPELGVGQYNVSNLKVQPAYGLWARHVKGLTLKNSTFNYEARDSRYALFLDDVTDAEISAIKMVRAADQEALIKLLNTSNVTIEKAVFFRDQWGLAPRALPAYRQGPAKGTITLPGITAVKKPDPALP